MPDNVPGKRLGRKVPTPLPTREEMDRPVTKIDYTDDRARIRFGPILRLSRDLAIKRGLLSPEDDTEKEGDTEANGATTAH